jgi:hypothetical protein
MPSRLNIGRTAVNDLAAAMVGGASSRMPSVLLKVSGANEAGEPNWEPTPTIIGPCQATSSHGLRWWMHTRPRPAMPSDRDDPPYKRGVTGSIPVALTRKTRSESRFESVWMDLKIV